MPEGVESLEVSDDYTLPVTDVLTGRGFVTGKSGSGKSNTASVVAEELLERGLGLMIVDTDGEYLGLNERYELLHAGTDERCDIDLETEDPRRIAELALDDNVPIVLDVSGYIDESESKAVIHDVVTELFVAEKEFAKPFLLFIEEAHEFIPQQGGGDDLSQLLIRVAKRGRKRGLGICAMSQRPAAVDKDYITQCNWLVWHRLTWENDTDVAGRILGDGADEAVQSLEDGQALVLTDWDETTEQVQFRRKRTVDDGSTPTLEEAYGPPSARGTHVTGTNTGDEATETASGGEANTRSENSPTEAENSSGTTVSFGGGVGSDGEDNRDVDAKNRSKSTNRPEQAGTRNRMDRTESASNTDRANRQTQTEPSTHRARRREVIESEPDDPTWEVALLVVYVYETVFEFHERVRYRIDDALLNGIARFRRRDAESERYTRYRPHPLERRAIRLLSLAVIVGFYAGLVVGSSAVLLG